MKLIFGADHAGVALKDRLISEFGFCEVIDLGTYSADSVDYPDFAHLVCDAVLKQSDAIGVLICGSGVGMSMAANRHQRIRCSLANDRTIAALARQHNDANVLALGARLVNDAQAIGILDTFLVTAYEGGRHANRVAKIEQVKCCGRIPACGASIGNLL